jgi:membrane protease YdiL (CAAX protease family)
VLRLDGTWLRCCCRRCSPSSPRHSTFFLGAQPPSADQLSKWTGIFSTFAIVVLIPGFGGAWEEPGWRGYAVPRLQRGRSALVAALILAVLIAGWHLPLMVAGQVHYSDIVLIVAAVIVFNWVFNNANGSVLIIMLMHAANNAVSGSFFSPMFSGADSVRQSWLLALVWAVAAVLVVLIAGPMHLSRKHHKQEETDDAAESGRPIEPVRAREQEG